MLPIRCFSCEHRFQRTAAAVLTDGRCPRCASADIDVDTDPALSMDAAFTASLQEPNDTPGSKTCPECGTANYDGGTCSNCGYAPDPTVKEGSLDAAFAKLAGSTPAEMPVVPIPQPASEVQPEQARCSSCFNEFAYKVADPTEPVPACPACGSPATSPAGAGALVTLTKREQIASSVLASNPGMARTAALVIADETIRRFPKVVE